MDADKRSGDEITGKIEKLRNRVAELEAQLSEKAGADASFREMSGHEILHSDSFYELDHAPKPLRVGSETTESIEVKSLFARDVTTSGSFDVRGGIWATTFGKVVQALPIPVFLIDESLKVTVANQACGRFTPYYEKIQGKPFASLFGGPSAAKAAQSLLEQVFSDRKARIGEGMLRIDNAMIWARITFRPIRIMDERYIIVLC